MHCYLVRGRSAKYCVMSMSVCTSLLSCQDPKQNLVEINAVLLSVMLCKCSYYRHSYSITVGTAVLIPTEFCLTVKTKYALWVALYG